MTPYRLSTPGIVKSVRQRWLVDRWQRASRDGRPPAWTDMDAGEIEACKDDLTILDVVGSGDGTRFRIHAHGRNLALMYSADCTGKFLDEVLPEATRAGVLETYRESVAAGQPVYTVSEVRDSGGRPVYYERLLLPFAGPDGRVTRVLGFLEMLSPDGRFDRDRLLADPGTAANFAVKAVLAPNAASDRA